jgi:hypothetical protein
VNGGDGAARDPAAAVGVVALLLGVRHQGVAGVSLAAVTAAVLLPVWGPAILAHRVARHVVVLAGLCCASAVVLAAVSSRSHAVDPVVAVTTMTTWLSPLLAAGALVWCAERIGVVAAVVTSTAGTVLSWLLTAPSADANPWKYALAVPVTILVTAALHRRPGAAAAVLPAVCGLSLVFAYRSHAALCVVVLVVALLRHRLRALVASARLSALLSVVVLTGIVVLVSVLGTAAALDGRLGEAIRQRTADQVATGGTLIEGGRPEWNGTVGLMRLHPMGYGPGVVPLEEDAAALKAGLRRVAVGVDGRYVNRYMLGGRFKLHSVVADLWSAFGVAGLALGLYLSGWFTARLLQDDGGGVRLLRDYLCLQALWFLWFGPILSNWPDVCAALAVLVAAGRRGPAAPDRLRPGGTAAPATAGGSR